MADATIAVKLLKDHTDAGIDHPAGAVITVDKPTADWLVGNKVGELVPAERAPKAA